jgi:copper chaperone NosL
MKKVDWLIGELFIGLGCLLIAGCAATEIKPVDLYPEDQCAQCRMAVSTDVFASEIITKEGDVFKFDDLGCQDQFLTANKELRVAVIFVKDYNSHAWITREQSTIVRTSLKTPMGSGKVAFRDSLKAQEFARQHTATEAVGGGEEQRGRNNAGRK